MKHNFKKIEPKWQKKWEEQQAFKAVDGSDKPKFYGLVELSLIHILMAAIRTAPAAVSLAVFARGLCSLVTRSTTDSTAVFTKMCIRDSLSTIG